MFEPEDPFGLSSLFSGGDPYGNSNPFAALYNSAFGGGSGGSPYSPGAWGSALSALAGGGGSGDGAGAYGIGDGLFGGFGGGGLPPMVAISIRCSARRSLAQLING